MRWMAALPIMVAAAAAHAQDRPAVVPSRDVDVIYHAGTVDQRMRWLAAAHKLRIDPPGAGMFMIVDYAAHRMAMVRPSDRKAIDMPSPADLPGAALPGGTYVRGAAATVAGLPCTDWTTRDNGGAPATVCFTSDGVMLRASRDGQVLVQATSVTFAPQDPADFAIPPGYQVLTPPPPQP